nr:hypothetical protein HmN_001020200 [Hymenolepis microstoma]
MLHSDNQENEFVNIDRPEITKGKDWRVNAIYFAYYRDDEIPAFEISLKVGDKSVKFVLDTCAGATLISEKSLNLLPPMLSINTPTREYSEQMLNIRGKFMTEVEYEGKLFDLMVYVVRGNHQNLLVRNWINHVGRIECPGKRVNGRDYIDSITIQRKRIVAPCSPPVPSSTVKTWNRLVHIDGIYCEGLKKRCDEALSIYRNLQF